jgi:hypothetical protein
MQRFSELGAAQRAAGHEEQRDHASRVTLGAIVPHVVARGYDLQARVRSGGWRGRDKGSNR